MARIAFYQVVLVLPSESTVALGVAHRQGIVMGVAEGQEGVSYAVLVGETTYMVAESDLETTGRQVDRSEVYGGETVEVDPERYDHE